MFTVFIDDSGTDPKQHVAIATVLIIPARQIIPLDKEMAGVYRKFNFPDFHMAECAAHNEGRELNAKSHFAQWDHATCNKVMSRVRQISKKIGVNAFSMAINKADYDELVIPRMRELGDADRFHYTWVMRSMLSLIDKWAALSNVTLPLEYVFDWMDPNAQGSAREEIETLMAQSEHEAGEHGDAGRYVNYSFRRRQDVPALQCTDAIAWTCYQFALHAYRNKPLTETAKKSWADYSKHSKKEWLTAVGMKRQTLKEWVEREIADGESAEKFKAWNIAHPPKKRTR